MPNPHPDADYVARFTFPEFTAICPVTGQPDFATLVIDYVPRGWLVESKSLKLYLNSFRNHGAFHEECTVAIGKKLVALLKPKWLRIGGYFHPRGGMPIDVVLAGRKASERRVGARPGCSNLSRPLRSDRQRPVEACQQAAHLLRRIGGAHHPTHDRDAGRSAGEHFPDPGRVDTADRQDGNAAGVRDVSQPLRPISGP